MTLKPKVGKIKRSGNPAKAISSEDVLWHWCREGWKYRGFNKTLSAKERKEYAARVKHEVDLIVSKDFVDYFLMLSDVVRKAKDRGVAVGPARGSAAASLVCYLLRITEVNPLQFPLMLFERFIDPNRHDLPDVDLDFEDDRRDEVRQIMIEKYGADRVGNIGTFTRYRGKNAIDDVARVHQIPRSEVEEAKEFIVERSGGDSRFDASIMDTVEMFPKVKEVFDKHPALYKSIELEGNYKSFGVHAAGLVVGQEPLWKYVSTYSKANVGRDKKTVAVLSVDKYDGEYLGLLKLDALGLVTMGMLRHALDMVGMSLEQLYDIPLDDPETLAAFERADVTGIFQFEGRTMKMVCERLKPKTFMDLAAVNALARPGPLNSGSTSEYIAIRHGEQQVVELHPRVSEICASTEGQIIYQEQILQICGDIGKLPWTHRNAIRRVISQRKGESAFNELWEQFREGAVGQGIEEPVAKEIWKRMVTAGTYAFNIAHCVSYSMLGFWAMWFKVHHPLAFYAAQLRKATDPDKRLMLMRDMMDARYGRSYKVHAPDVLRSARSWTAVDDGVLAGIEQIPGVGGSKADLLLAARDEGIIKDWEDVALVKGFGVRTVEKIREFADADDPFGIYKIQRQRAAIIKAIRDGDIAGVPLPNTLSDDIPYEAKSSSHVILGVITARNLQDMFENHRARVGEELDPNSIERPDLKDSMGLYVEDTTGNMTVKIHRYNYPAMKDKLWSAKVGHDFMLASVKKYPYLGQNVHVQKLWIIDPD